jgi:hypothetical protein
MNAMIIATYSLVAGCRVRTSEGKAHFLFPHVVEKDGVARIEVALLSNSYGAEWVRFPKGTELTLLGVADKTDTYLMAVQLPAGEDGVRPDPKGIVLRKAGFAEMKEAAQETTPAVLAFIHQVPEPAAIEVEEAPAEIEVAEPASTEPAPTETTVTEPETTEQVQAAPAETEQPRRNKNRRQAEPTVEDILNEG